ncbi:MAG: ABC transporter ATP-binding protein [Planctomycetes bacterium]|nr:ABC transporter ATP-binding protein [Planctomycetota bacterium]
MVELRNVSKRFGRLHVLRGVNISFERGKTTVIIGASGAGKSVILKHIVRLLMPDDGEVLCNGQRIDTMSDRDLVSIRMRFGFLFQMGALFDSLTVAENVAFPIVEHTRRSRSDIAKTVAQKLAMVGLDGLQGKKPAQLSGGQRKRVALARAISLEPEIILYDEPTTGLDPIRSDIINELIIKLQRELNVTSIVVTHDMASVRRVGDRVVMLHEGHFVFDGTPAEMESCSTPTVRQFVEGRAGGEQLAGI